MPSTQGAPGDQPRGAFSFLALGHPHQRKLARHHSYGAFAAAWGDPGRIPLSCSRSHLETTMSDCVARHHPRAEPMDDPMLSRYYLPPPEPSP